MPAIEASNLSKRYRVYSSPWQRLREAIAGGGRAREFLALDDVSIRVPAGSALGVVGPNGAGKSTLLKILAGIVEPTSGKLRIDGKVASIIELGAGFHPEFTGRENVFLNAAILGYPSAQTREVFSRVEQFCELGKYIDMPVKTYSSGMFVRLAFAVAISAEPDVLLVDEALAVGDAVFAHRCLARIREMRARGCTIVFVTHDTNTLTQVCDRAIFLDHGRLIAEGPPADVVHLYLLKVAERLTASTRGQAIGSSFHTVGAIETTSETAEKRFGSFEARITDCIVEDVNGKPFEKLVSGLPARFRMIVRFDRAVENPVFGVMLKNRHGVEMFGTNTHLRRIATGFYSAGDACEVCFDCPMQLGAGVYTASYALHTADGHFFDYRVDARIFEVFGPTENIGVVNLPVQVAIRPVAADLAAKDDLASRLYHDAPSALSMEADCERFLAGAWYAPQEMDGRTYRWLGAGGLAFLAVPATATRLILEARTLCPDVSMQPLSLTLAVGDETVGEYVFETQEWSQIALPLPLSARGGIVAISLRAGRAWVPREFNPQSTDTRELSVLVSRIGTE